MFVNWGSNVTPAGSLKCSPFESAEFGVWAALFREYRITGVKIKWIPIQVVTSGLPSSIDRAYSCSSIDEAFGHGTTDTTLYAA